MTIAVSTLLLATPAAQADRDSGAVRSTDSSSGLTATAPEHCRDAWIGLAFYRRSYNQHREDRGAATSWPVGRKPLNCSDARQLAKVWRSKAKRARVKLERWLADEWAWQRWLPAKYYRVARCETGVRWDWDSGKYVSAFGIIRVAYEWYHPWTGHNTPREQYEVAAAIQRRFGWGAWGCGGA